MERLRILVLFGGCSSEHEVSLQSAHGVLTHMDPERYCPIPVGITREGAWYVYTGPLDAIPGGRWQREAACVPCTLRLDRGNRALVLLDGSGREVAFDLAFPVLHGRNGEDGTVQGALELAGVPLVGCGTLSSALCMDKDRAHKLAALAGVRVPRSRLFPEDCAFEELRTAAENTGLAAVCQAGAGGFFLRREPGGGAGTAGSGGGGGLPPRRRDFAGGGHSRL